MFLPINYLPPAEILVIDQKPTDNKIQLPIKLSNVKPPVKDGPGGRESGGGR